MSSPRGPLRVARVNSSWTRRDGTVGGHQSVLLRRAWKEDGKVRRHTVASLTGLPAAEIDALEAVFNRGERPEAAVAAVNIGSGAEHGNVAAVLAAADQIGLPGMLGEAGRMRDLALGLIVARLCRPASKIAQAAWWAETTMGEDLGLVGASAQDPYRAMDWLFERKGAIEAALAQRYLKDAATNPASLVMFDLTSTWVEGTKCELAQFGHSRDGKKGLAQIEFAIIANPQGVPVGVRTYPGATSDPEACKAAITAIRDEFGMGEAVLVGDRGMVTGTRIKDLKAGQIGWIGALRHAAIRKLAADDGPLQMSLFDEQDLFHLTSPDFPGEVLVACRNPHRGEQDAAKRERLINATLADLDKIAARVERGTLVDVGAIERAVGKIIDKRKVARLIQVRVDEAGIAYGPNRPAIAAEAELDGVYVIRTSLSTEQMGPAEVVAAYQQLRHVERDFKWIKSTDISVRPIRHWNTNRVEAHLLICVLAALLEHHLRTAWAPLTFTDEQPPPPTSPSVPARRSTSADAKAATRKGADGLQLRGFRALLDHLAKLTRHHVTIETSATNHTFTELSEPTPTQTRAFQLLGTKPPKTLR